MLNPRHIGLLLAVFTALLVVPNAAPGVCTQGNRPCPAPMLYPGEIGVYPGCCPGPCMCIPNMGHWGHYRRDWSQWPGDETRVDIRLPAARGIETIPTPPGSKPEPLPKEEYAPLETAPGPRIKVGEGAPTGPIEPPVPFDFGPGFEGGLPGLDVTPEGPLPETPPGEGTPETGTLQQPGTMEIPATDSVPPAPLPNQSGVFPKAPGPLLGAEYPTPPAPAAEPSTSLSSVDTVAGKQSEALPAMETLQSTVLTDKRSSAVEDKAAETAPLPEITDTPEWAAASPELLSAGSPAPLPETELPWLPEAASAEQASRPESPSRAWKSRRTQGSPSVARKVDYEEPVESNKVGLEGYCPVELVRNEQWVQGKPQLAVEHEGQTYWMSGPRQHRLFRADPGRYAPVLSGRDPVLAATGKGLVAGRTDACVIYGGRLFMFCGRATLARFQRDPKRFTADPDRPAK